MGGWLCRHVGSSTPLGPLLGWSFQGPSVLWEKSFVRGLAVCAVLAQDGEGHWILGHGSDASHRGVFN